jgi:hypothetical protein
VPLSLRATTAAAAFVQVLVVVRGDALYWCCHGSHMHKLLLGYQYSKSKSCCCHRAYMLELHSTTTAATAANAAFEVLARYDTRVSLLLLLLN